MVSHALGHWTRLWCIIASSFAHIWNNVYLFVLSYQDFRAVCRQCSTDVSAGNVYKPHIIQAPPYAILSQVVWPGLIRNVMKAAQYHAWNIMAHVFSIWMYLIDGWNHETLYLYTASSRDVLGYASPLTSRLCRIWHEAATHDHMRK